RQRPRHDHAHGVIEIRALHLFGDRNRAYARGILVPRLGVVSVRQWVGSRASSGSFYIADSTVFRHPKGASKWSFFPVLPDIYCATAKARLEPGQGARTGRCSWRFEGPLRDFRARRLFFESSSHSTLLLEHDLFRKPVSTFRDHALDMRIPLDFSISALVTLLVIVDPLALASTYVALTHGLPAQARRSVGIRAAIIAAAILIGAATGGQWLLTALGISLPAFRIAGGLRLFSIASEMVFGLRVQRQSKDAEQAVEERVRNIAAFPLAFPLLAGPGAITATVLLAGQTTKQPLRLIGLLVVIVL